MDRWNEIINKMTLEEKIRLCTGDGNWKTKAFDKYGIPYIKLSDGTSGVRFQQGSENTDLELDFYTAVTGPGFDSDEAVRNTIPATCFPSGSTLACSWNIELIENVGEAISSECKKLGINLLLGPGMNTRRHPLAARSFEYYSEDPCLSGELAAAMVSGVQKNGVGTSVKHFCCNNSEYKRTRMDSVVEERALREIYLAGFERVVKKSKPITIMGSYNKLNGIQACENEYLLTQILREEWGFNGAVISDWGAVKDPVEAMKSGLDLIMPQSEAAVSRLLWAVQNNELDEKVIDEKCRRILEMVFQLKAVESSLETVDFNRHHELARKASAESAVLLKNEGDILPIDRHRVKKIAVLGNLAIKPVFQGTGCAIINAVQTDTPLSEIEKLANPYVQVVFSDGYDEANRTDAIKLASAKREALNADVAVVFVGTSIVREKELHFDREHMNIEESHLRLLEAVHSVNKNVIVILMNGEAVTMPWLADARAVVDMWYGGQGCGNAVAAILFGKTNPSGRLPVSIPFKLSDTPAYLNYPGENDTHIYNEGIFVGYRYYDKVEREVQFPFGFGLSYTTFEYSKLRLSQKQMQAEDKLEIRLTVTNTGSCRGREIIQVYVQDKISTLKRPIRELKAFDKIELAPQESREISFSLEKRDFSYYNPDVKDWILETGEFEIQLGKSSRDICLCETVYIEGTKTNKEHFSADSLFCEILQNKDARDKFTDFLLNNHIASANQINEKLLEELKGMFWGIANVFDMFITGRVEKEKLDELIGKFNE